jgi:phage terminase small subunit
VAHKNSALSAAEVARVHLLRFAAEFGLTPAAESRLVTMPAEPGGDSDPILGVNVAARGTACFLGGGPS